MVNLVGPTSQQDVELSALYRDAVIAYGEGKVLGILAAKGNNHELMKRAAESDETTTSIPTIKTIIEPTLTEDELQEDFIYYSESYKILLHTHSPPILTNGSAVTVLNDTKMTITTNRRSSYVQTLKVRYNSQPGQVRFTLHFVFIQKKKHFKSRFSELNDCLFLISVEFRIYFQYNKWLLDSICS